MAKKSEQSEMAKQKKQNPTLRFDYFFDEDAKIGDEIEFEGRAKMTSISSDQWDDEERKSQTFEITKIKKKGGKEMSYNDALKQTKRAAFDKE